MPNVMGREFPYTPQGMAQAQQYKEALGMRDGGSMGFRPVGYEAGGPVGYADGDAVNQNTQTYSDFDRALKEMPVENLNAYLRENMFQLKAMAEDNPARAAQLSDVMEKTGFEGYMLNLMQGSMPNSPGVVPNEGGGFDYYPPQTGMEQTMPDPTGVPPEGGDQMIMQRPYRVPVNPDTGLPWTDEERGPMRRTPKEDGRGYYTGDNSGNMTSTMEFVPSRYPPGFFDDAIKPLQMPPPPVQRAGGGIMSLGRR